jgi:hypothetical protein
MKIVYKNAIDGVGSSDDIFYLLLQHELVTHNKPT